MYYTKAYLIPTIFNDGKDLEFIMGYHTMVEARKYLIFDYNNSKHEKQTFGKDFKYHPYEIPFYPNRKMRRGEKVGTLKFRRTEVTWITKNGTYPVKKDGTLGKKE